MSVTAATFCSIARTAARCVRCLTSTFSDLHNYLQKAYPPTTDSNFHSFYTFFEFQLQAWATVLSPGDAVVNKTLKVPMFMKLIV